MENGCTVLVVDDDPAVRELLGEILAPPEFEVVAVADAQTARAALAERCPVSASRATCASTTTSAS